MKWLKDIQSILGCQDETWLAYLHGQKIDDIPRFKKERPRFRGFFLRSLIALHFYLSKLRWKSFPVISGGYDFFVYAGTINQMNAIDSTVDSIRDKGGRVLAIGEKCHLNTKERKGRNLKYSASVFDFAKVLCLFLMRAPCLAKELKRKDAVLVEWYFDNFCYAYFYLVFFYLLLRKVRPKCVVVANDHNVENRCLLAVAAHLNIKTAYVQHASVSRLFPALQVTYAFLDGKSALETYLECDNNKPCKSVKLPSTKVFLSGQKKVLRDKKGQKVEKSIGVALNALDDFDNALLLVRKLVEVGFHIRLRLHPGQVDSAMPLFKSSLSDVNEVVFSNPKEESIMDFMSSISKLVAGNSSIHLEAALSGVLPIYYELAPSSISDYYGYVSNGLALSADGIDNLVCIACQPLDIYSLNDYAIRNYSSTFMTEWQGREGELVASSLFKLLNGEDAEKIFGYVSC